MKLITDAQWKNFQDLIGSDAHDTFFQKVITWKRTLSTLDRFSEDNKDGTTGEINLTVLLNYNYMRTWPITFASESGELDRQSIQMLISKSYLEELGYINTNGYFEYNPDLDRFIIDGLVHKPMGDTPISQASDGDLLFGIILKREETPTGDKR